MPRRVGSSSTAGSGAACGAARLPARACAAAAIDEGRSDGGVTCRLGRAPTAPGPAPGGGFTDSDCPGGDAADGFCAIGVRVGSGPRGSCTGGSSAAFPLAVPAAFPAVALSAAPPGAEPGRAPNAAAAPAPGTRNDPAGPFEPAPTEVSALAPELPGRSFADADSSPAGPKRPPPRVESPAPEAGPPNAAAAFSPRTPAGSDPPDAPPPGRKPPNAAAAPLGRPPAPPTGESPPGRPGPPGISGGR